MVSRKQVKQEPQDDATSAPSSAAARKATRRAPSTGVHMKSNNCVPVRKCRKLRPQQRARPAQEGNAHHVAGSLLLVILVRPCWQLKGCGLCPSQERASRGAAAGQSKRTLWWNTRRNPAVTQTRTRTRATCPAADRAASSRAKATGEPVRSSPQRDACSARSSSQFMFLSAMRSALCLRKHCPPLVALLSTSQTFMGLTMQLCNPLQEGRSLQCSERGHVGVSASTGGVTQISFVHESQVRGVGRPRRRQP